MMNNKNIFHDTRPFLKNIIRANELKIKSDYRKALDIYLDVAEKIDDAYLFAAVAFCYFRLSLDKGGSDKDIMNALTWIERAIASDSGNSIFYSQLADIHRLATLDYDLAIAACRQAIALNPDNLDAIQVATSLYGVPEDVITLDEAIALLEHAVLLAPQDPFYHARLGDLYNEAKRPLDAYREFLRALLCPNPLKYAGFIIGLVQNMDFGADLSDGQVTLP